MLIDDMLNELTSALQTLEPQIRGLEDLTRASISSEALGLVATELNDRLRRRDLCFGVLNTLGALKGDGYPAMPKGQASKDIYDELQGQLADYTTALAEIEALPSVNVELGSPAFKPTT